MARRVSKKPATRHDIIKWPAEAEPVEFQHALIAIAFRNARILARYLREADPVSSQITNLIAFMLDPEGHPVQEPDAEGDRDTDWCLYSRLEFKRSGPGNRKNFPEIDMGLWQIGAFVEAIISNGVKTEAAISEASSRLKCSRAQAYNGLKAIRRLWSYSPGPTDPDEFWKPYLPD